MYVGPLRMSEENVKKVHDRPATQVHVIEVIFVTTGDVEDACKQIY